MKYTVRPASRREYAYLLLEHHYAKRLPPTSFAFGMFDGDRCVGVVTFGTPASRHLQIGACASNPSAVVELNRLCLLPEAPRNSESWLLSRALKLMPGRIVVSYADTAQGHVGYVYRAANFRYAGWTDMDRKTPRFDYVVPGKHSRDAFRSGLGVDAVKVRRKPKVKYWTVTGDRRKQRMLLAACSLPSLSWKETPPPSE